MDEATPDIEGLLAEVARLKKREEIFMMLIRGKLANISNNLESDEERQLLDKAMKKLEENSELEQENTSIYTDFQNVSRWK